MKFKSYVIFFLLFGVAPDLYLCLQMLPEAAVAWKAALCLPTLGTMVCLPLIGAGIRYTDSVRAFSYLTFLFELPKFVLALFSVVGRNAIGLVPVTADWIAAGAGIAVSLFFAVLIFYTTRHLKVNEVDLSFERLPLHFDGLRICHLSDLHLGSFGKTASYIERIIDTTLSLAPDLILFTGDLVNFESSEAEPYLDDLSRLHAPLGIFAIRGNHDYLLHGHHNEQERLADTDRLLAMEQTLGWRILLNAHALLQREGDQMALVGVENVSSNPFFSKVKGDLKAALAGLPEGIFTILMSHDPSHWLAEVVPDSDVALTLSGHTHGLKYKLAGLNPSHWRLPHPCGVFVEKGRVLHVSEGLGSAFAFRLSGFPKIDLITLRHARNKKDNN